MRTILIALLMTLATQAGAEVYDKNFNFKGTKFLVMLHDIAKGGCWTNLREVREYAEEKLRIKGATLTEDGWDSNTFLLEILIQADRNPNAQSQCFGALSAYIVDMKYYKEPGKRVALVSKYGFGSLRSPNMNIDVLDLVADALAEFE